MLPSILARSIPTRVAFLVALIVVAMASVTGVASYMTAISDAETFLARKGRAYAVLAAREIAPAIVFEDMATAREVLDAIAMDPDVVEASLLRADGSVLETRSRGESFGRNAELTTDAKAEVRPREGGRGQVVVRLSSASLGTAKTRAMRTSFALATGALLFGIAGAFLIGVSLRRRLRALTEVAAAIAEGDHRRRPERTGSGDEIDQLSGAFETMLGHLEELRSTQARVAAEEQGRLDGLVRERTRELEARHGEVRLLLDHMSDGVITMDRSGILGSEGSRVLDRWFGPAGPDQKFWTYLSSGDATVASRLEMGWASVVDDLLPLELSLEQLPQLLRVGPTSYELRVAPIECGATTPERFLIVVRDVTSSLERDAAAADARELGAALEHIARDREGFVEQLRELDGLSQRLAAADEPRPDVLRDLHTLKGNAAMLGFLSVATHCHEWEDRIQATQELPAGELRRRLVERWEAIRGSLAPLLADAPQRAGVDRADLARLEDGIRSGRPRGVLLSLTRALTMDRAESHLTRLAEYARVSGRALPGEIEVVVECDDVRLEAAAFSSLWAALVHVVRNAISHGIEPADERVATGKAARGAIRISCTQGPTGVEISVGDDGRGIDWEQVRTLASARGLPASSQRDLEEALFADGFSTSETVTEIAGRGQGMSAVLAAVRALEGTMGVQSQKGRGTTWSVVIPDGPQWLRRTTGVTRGALLPSLSPAEAS